MHKGGRGVPRPHAGTWSDDDDHVVTKCVVCVVRVMIEDKKPVKIETPDVVDETDTVRRGYVRKTRSRAWTNKGPCYVY